MKATPTNQAAPQPASNAGQRAIASESSGFVLISRPQAAALLKISTRKLDALRASGAIPSRQIDRARRYLVAELRAWIAAGCPTDPDAGERIRQKVSEGGGA